MDDVTAELRKWGVRHLLIWSRASVAGLQNAERGLFAERWSSGIWHDFEYRLDARHARCVDGCRPRQVGGI